MSNQLIKDRPDWTASLAWLVEPVILLIGCGLLVATAALSVRLAEDNLNCLVPSQRDDARSEQDSLPWHPVQGQQLYVPAYSHVFQQNGDPYLLSVTLNIRNTDGDGEIVVTSVRYFDTGDKELRSLLDKPLKLSPMAATEFVIARGDKTGGSGASFLVEWKAKTKVTPPLVEAVNVDTRSTQGLSSVVPAIVLDDTEMFDLVPQVGT